MIGSGASYAPRFWTWDAAFYCSACTRERFGAALDDGTAEDSEGNQPHPVAPWDEAEFRGWRCDGRNGEECESVVD